MSLYECQEEGITVGDMVMQGNLVAEFPLNCPAWHVENLHEWWVLTELRGRDRVRPGAPGEYSVLHTKAKVRRNVELFISGGVDMNGDPHPSLMEGLYLNVQAFEQNLVEPNPTSPTGLRTLSLTVPTGDVKVGLVRVKSFEYTEIHPRARHCYAVLDVEVPAGGIT